MCLQNPVTCSYKRYMKSTKCKCGRPLGQCQDNLLEHVESEATQALIFSFDSASPGKYCFVVDFVLLSLSCGIQKHSSSQAQQKKTVQINDAAKAFLRSIVKAKHQRLTSKAFMQLVPDANQVVHYYLHL